MFVLASLTEEKLKAIRRFENQSGLRVLALAPLEVEPAMIDAETLAKLQELEQELGVYLLAVR